MVDHLLLLHKRQQAPSPPKKNQSFITDDDNETQKTHPSPTPPPPHGDSQAAFSMCNITNFKTLTNFVIVCVQLHKTLNHLCDMHKEC